MTEMKILKNSVLLIRFLLKHIYRKKERKEVEISTWLKYIDFYISFFIMDIYILYSLFIVYIPMCLGNLVY